MATFDGSNELPIRANLKIVQDPIKGRCFVATCPYRVGDVLFTEEAFVYASFNEGARLSPQAVQQYRAVYKPAVLKDMDDLLEELTHLDSVQSLDTARCFLQLVAIAQLRFLNLVSDHCTQSQLWYLDQLTGHSIDQCTEDVRQFRVSYPTVIPKNLSDGECGRLLALLSTNQVELEEFGGSGLFLGTSIFQHDCYPNCSFSTDSSTLTMTAIREISAGDAVSLDYGNNFYRPTHERVEALEDTYGFVCQCTVCVGPDRTRSFVCGSCRKGVVFAVGMCESIESDSSFTACAACAKRTTLAYRERCLAREDELRDEKPLTLVEMEELLVGEEVVHDSHHLLFWAWDELAMHLASQIQKKISRPASAKRGAAAGVASDYREALDAMKRTIALLEAMLPQVHHEKVVYYDRQGQLEVAAGLISQAKESFRRSYIMSKMAMGEFAPATIKIKRLVDDTPRTTSELQAHYTAAMVEDDGGGDFDADFDAMAIEE